MDVWKGNLGVKGYDFRALLSNMGKYRITDAEPSDLSFVLNSEYLAIYVSCMRNHDANNEMFISALAVWNN